MSSQDARWALETAIVDYAKTPIEKRDFVPVQHAITKLIGVAEREGYAAGQEDRAIDMRG